MLDTKRLIEIRRYHLLFDIMLDTKRLIELDEKLFDIDYEITY